MIIDSVAKMQVESESKGRGCLLKVACMPLNLNE